MGPNAILSGLPGDRDTASLVLDAAERLVQTRGFNSFSYADVARELELTKAALHYHFATKADLGEALLERFAARFASALDAIDATPANALDKLEAYADLYLDVLRRDQMCLCGMLAAEYRTLPERMQVIVVRFFNDNEAWLTGVVERGQSEGTIDVAVSPHDAARSIVAAFEGAMLIARPFGDVAWFQATAVTVLNGLGSAASVPARGQ